MSWRNNRGSALIATVVISLLLISLTFWYFQWSMSHSRENTHGRAIQRALEYAESGLDSAQQAIRQPDTPVPTVSLDMPNGRIEYTILLDTTNPKQLQVYSTGYYDLTQGAFEDPVTHHRSQQAVVRALLYVDAVDKVQIATPGQLIVNPGTIVNDAIYAKDLIFPKGPMSTNVQSSFYSHSIVSDDGTSTSNIPYVNFGTTPVLLGYPLQFPHLGASFGAYYKQYATTLLSQLSDGSELDGSVSPPAGSTVPVYYCDGNLDVSKLSVLNPGSSFIVYVTGNLRIYNAVNSQGNAWIVFLVEKDIEIDSNVPANLTLSGTFIANGKITADGTHPGILTINGSLIAGEGIDLAAAWKGSRRMYFHRQADPLLPIPHLTEMIDYTVVQGKIQ